MEKIKETDLAQRFVEYLSCYDLYFEVGAGSMVDIVAVSGSIIMGYEVKTSFNFRVIEQAYRNIHWFNYSYVCVPYGRDHGFQYQICRDYGIGVLEWREYGSISPWSEIVEKVKPKLNRAPIKDHVRLHEYQKRSIPGTSSGGRITPFTITKENMVKYVSRHPGCTIKEMMNNISHHYHSTSGAIATTYQWLRRGIIKDIYLDKGKLYLNQTCILGSAQ